MENSISVRNSTFYITLDSSQVITPEKRLALMDKEAQVISHELWLTRNGDNIVAKACLSAFKNISSKDDKTIAAKQHMLSYAALKLDRLQANGSNLTSPKTNKLVLSELAKVLGINKSSAGKSALESAARVIADKGRLDCVENDSPELKKRIREKLISNLLDSLTENMNHVVNKYIEKHELRGTNHKFFTSNYVDGEVYDALLILRQVNSDTNIQSINQGLA